MKSKKFINIWTTLLIVAAFCLINKTNIYAEESTIRNGIYIEDVDVSGMTAEEAKKSVEDTVNEWKNREITLQVNQDTVTVKAGDLGLEWSNTNIIDEALALGKEANIVKRYMVIKDLSQQPKVFTIETAVNKDAVTNIINEKCVPFNKEAVDATVTKNGNSFDIVEGQQGQVINVENSSQIVMDYMSAQWDRQNAAISLELQIQEPKGTKEELSKIKDVLGTFTTSFKSSGTARTANVRNGARLINGRVLYPGDTFSAYEAVSPFTEKNGYYMAGSYLNGMVVDSLGGGICQVSTTLYNAVLRSELQVVERSNHSMIVGYVDPSADAAIAGTYKDFKFTNNKQDPIYIEGYTTPDKKITFTIYGCEDRPANREVSFVSETLSTTEPGPDQITADASQGIGYIDIQEAHKGYVAKLYKVVKENGVEVSREEVNKSTYKMAPRYCTVGVNTADPNAYNAIMAAIATGSVDAVRSTAAAYSGTAADPAAQAAAQAAAAQATADASAQAAAAAAQAQATPPAQ